MKKQTLDYCETINCGARRCALFRRAYFRIAWVTEEE
jgi:hypothetical protein